MRRNVELVEEEEKTSWAKDVYVEFELEKRMCHL